MGLSAYKQVRFPGCVGTFGLVTLVINRPTYESLTQPATDTLMLGEGGEYYPFMVAGDFSLSKKFTTTRGRRALDDLNVGIRDGLSYTGKVNGGAVSEDFTSSFETFFDVWFNDTRPYKAFILYTDAETGNSEVTHEGWIDPTYKPSSDAIVFNALTNEQIWLGTRTIKMTALAQAQISLTWGNVLAAYNATSNPNVPTSYMGITASDCQEGTPYNGFMMAPQGLGGQQNTRADLFSSSTGSLMQAVTYKQLDWSVNPCMVKEDAAVWPLNPWQSTAHVNDIALASIAFGGLGYAVNDTGTINTGSTLAHYKITSVHNSGPAVGIVDGFILTDAGAGYATGTNIATTNIVGSGVSFRVNIDKVGTQNLWGPSGLVFIKLSTLFDKLATAIGIGSPTVTSALRFWRQLVSGNCFPIDTANPIDPADIYISLDVYAKSHPYDGSYWDNPVGWSFDTAATDVLTSLCNLLLIDFNTSNASDGTQTLVLNPMGTTAGTLPDWPLIGVPQQEEPSTGARIVQAKYKADDLTIQAPLGIVGDASAIEIPARIHRIGKTSGSDILPDKECLFWDNSKLQTDQADSCFKISWFEQSTGITHVQPDCWKSLCYLYWFHSGSSNPGVYPSNWNAFDNTSNWSNSFFAINAITRAKNPDGTDFTAAADLQAQIQGNDYFNLRNYTAVAFAALTLPQPTVQTYTFFGISDSSGSIQAIKAGLASTWRFGSVASQNWVAIQLDQLLLAGETTVKFQQYGNVNGFPALTDLAYGPVNGTGGTSSTTGGGSTSSSSGTQNPKDVSYVFPVNSITLSAASTNNVAVLAALTNQSQAVIVSNTHGAAITMTGMIAPSQNCTVLLYNAGAYELTLSLLSGSSSAANQINGTNYANVKSVVQAGGMAMLIYDTTNTRWQIIDIFPVPAEQFDATYFTVTQASDGAPIITLNATWLATLVTSGTLAGYFLKDSPANQTVQSSTLLNYKTIFQAKSGDTVGQTIVQIKDASGTPVSALFNNGGAEFSGPVLIGDGANYTYIRTFIHQVDIQPYIHVILGQYYIFGLDIGTAEVVKLTDTSGNVGVTYNLCGILGGVGGRHLEVYLDGIFITNLNQIQTDPEDINEPVATNRLSDRGGILRLFYTAEFRYDDTNDNGGGPLNRWIVKNRLQ